MTRFVAYLLTALMLFQTMGQELLVLQYALNKAEITARYCVNKDQPRLQCDGKCYLAKKMRRAAKDRSEAPNSNSVPTKIKFEALLPLRLVPPAPVAGFPARPRYARAVASHYHSAPLNSLFQPPAYRS